MTAMEPRGRSNAKRGPGSLQIFRGEFLLASPFQCADQNLQRCTRVVLGKILIAKCTCDCVCVSLCVRLLVCAPVFTLGMSVRDLGGSLDVEAVKMSA